MPSDSESARWFAEHLQVHEPLLRSWLQSRFPAIGDFDDIIQDAYIRILQARTKREIQQPKAYFFATARNLACCHYRRSHLSTIGPLGEPDDFPVLDETVDITETIARNQELEIMTQAIQALPERCRQVLTLRNVYGLSYREIATQLNISLKTVEAHLATGVKRCADYVGRFQNK